MDNERRRSQDPVAAVIKDLMYVWRLSMTHDLPTLRAYIRRRCEGLLDDNPHLQALYDVQVAIIQDLARDHDRT